MSQNLTIQDTQYKNWIAELKDRYQSIRLKAAVQVNISLLQFYYSVGKDIADRQYANTYGTAFYETLSRDLQAEFPGQKGFSASNIRYMYRFYSLYCQLIENLLQGVENLKGQNLLQGVDDLQQPYPASNLPQVAENLLNKICSIPWFHQQRIIDKCDDPLSALFYVEKTLENGWSRDLLLNALKSGLHTREGKAISNFKARLPETQSDLAQQITKDPYNFDFLTLTKGYEEKELEDALVANVTRFLLELGTGFAYMGRQFRMQVGSEEFFPDLLFYNTRLRAYCVVELKIGKFKPEYLGQLGFYVSAVNHQFKTEADNPTIGLLICSEKDNVVAQYALESSSQPIGISEYQLSQLYPADFKSSLPTIKEIEEGLKES